MTLSRSASSLTASLLPVSRASVARFYERLGDHAVNVAGRVSYLAGSQKPRDT